MIDPAGALLLGAVAGLAVQGARLHGRWRAGQPARIDWVRGLARVPRAYLHTVHDVVARDRYAARMHMLAAGGLLAALALSVLRHVLGIGGDVVAVAILASIAIAMLGVAMVAARRWPTRQPRLSGGAFDRLPAALGGCLLFLLLAALLTLPDPGWRPSLQVAGRIAMVALGLVSLGALVRWSADGPMRHAVAGIVHLATLPRAARLAGERSTDLAPLDLPDDALPPRLGVAAVADLPWPRLAQFDACVQCGRCREACPAHAAGQPLDPRAFIQALARQTAQAPRAALVPDVLRPETLWSCTTCRACVHECPMLIEHVDAIVDLRRFETLERGAVPPKAALALTELVQADTVSGQPLAARLDWAADLGLRTLTGADEAEMLLWVGEGGFDRRNQRSLRAFVALLRRAGVDVAVLGDAEADCGDLARRLGDEVTFQTLARRNVATLARRRFARIATMDPHALHVLRNEYPAFGGRYKVEHHTEVLDALFAEGRLRAEAVRERMIITYHDPCYLARYNGEVAVPRRLLGRIGAEVTEMERAGLRARCCGWGGGAAFADVPATRRIPDLRMDQARATGAAVVAVACPNCANMLEGVTGPRPEVADIAELVLAALGAEAAA